MTSPIFIHFAHHKTLFYVHRLQDIGRQTSRFMKTLEGKGKFVPGA
jgi:hypothetical protein